MGEGSCVEAGCGYVEETGVVGPEGQREVVSCSDENTTDPCSWAEEACPHCKGYPTHPDCTCSPDVLWRREARVRLAYAESDCLAEARKRLGICGLPVHLDETMEPGLIKIVFDGPRTELEALAYELRSTLGKVERAIARQVPPPRVTDEMVCAERSEMDSATWASCTAGLDIEPDCLVVAWLVGCARCHGDGHANLMFMRLRHPVEQEGGPDLTHWSFCPETGEPILMGTAPAE
jgi:hypothetical protein